MSAKTQAFFIVSSGRSGTAMLHKALAAADSIEMHHEYLVHILQPLAVKRYLGLADADEAQCVLAASHGAAIHYSDKAHWGDSSNKLSWLIPELAELLPEAKFVHLVRDGRKVASSYFHKLADECYDDRSTAILQDYYDSPGSILAPPPDKKYWWPLPLDSDPRATEFRHFDQFSRIAWHWAEINRTILAALSTLQPERHIFARLEDLLESPHSVAALFKFLGLPYRYEHFELFARPHNVNQPLDRPLTNAQRSAFDYLADGMMVQLGYAGRPEYVVKY